VNGFFEKDWVAYQKKVEEARHSIFGEFERIKLE
jgi:hypothetical protein